MKKNALSFVVLFCLQLSLGLVYSCTKPGGAGRCGGEGPIYTCTKMNGFEALAYRTGHIQLGNNDEVKYTELTLLALFRGEKVTCFRGREGNPFISAAYACSPVEKYNPKDPIASITITSNADFDAAHLAGSPLNAYFDIPAIDEINGRLDYTDSDSQGNRGISTTSLQLKQAPAAEGVHTFTVSVTLASGVVYNAACVPVKILR